MASDSDVVEPCYVSPAKEYRKQMAGSFEATELPKPSQEAIPDWQEVETGFQDLRRDLEAALRKAAEAHEGKASEAAQASIKELDERLELVANAAGNIKNSLELQVEHQNSTFHELPAPGQKLPNGADMQFDPPEKSWWEDTPVLSWFSDYEERQEAFHATNEKAELIMSGYQAKTEGVVGRLPQFQPEEKPPAAGTTAPAVVPAAGQQLHGQHHHEHPVHPGQHRLVLGRWLHAAADSPDELYIWETENGERSVSLGVMDRKIQDYYDGKSFYPDYREFTIAGYPAVRANQGDPSADGICAMAVAINDNQVLTVTTMDLPIIDPCGLAQKSLEAAVPNLPEAN